MVSKKLVPAVVLLLLVVAAAIVGASQLSGVRVPPGAIVDSPNANANPGIPNPPVGKAPALPPATSDVLFSDDFSKGLDRWESLSTATGTWVVEDGRLQQRGDANGDVVLDDQPAVLLAKDTRVDNAILEAAIYPVSSSPVGVVFRGSDQGYYRVKLYVGPANDHNSLAFLDKVVAPNRVVEIASAPVGAWSGFTLEKWLIVKAVTSGNQITVSVDGLPLISATDDSFSSGWAGLWTIADRGAQFDNVRIQRAPGR